MMVQKNTRKKRPLQKKREKRKETRVVVIGAPAYRRTIERGAAMLYTNINHRVGIPKKKEGTISD